MQVRACAVQHREEEKASREGSDIASEEMQPDILLPRSPSSLRYGVKRQTLHRIEHIGIMYMKTLFNVSLHYCKST